MTREVKRQPLRVRGSVCWSAALHVRSWVGGVMRRTLRTKIEYVLKRPEWLIAFGVGVILGALLCMPIVHSELPSGAGELMGAAMGALIAIGGSFWLVARQEEKDQRGLRGFICLCGMDAVDALISVSWAGVRDLTAVTPSALEAIDELAIARQRFGLVENRLYTLEPIVVRWYVVFIRRMSAAVERMRTLQNMTLPKDEQEIFGVARGMKMCVLGLNDMLEKIADDEDTRASVQARVDSHVELGKAYNSVAAATTSRQT